MKRLWKRGRDALDLEAELRSTRPEPRREFLDVLAARVREDRPLPRRGSVRIALATGLSGLVLVALASVGGLEYASAAIEEATSLVDGSDPGTTSHDPSHTQYGKRCGNPHADKERKIKLPPCPVIVHNATAKEGNSGTTSLTFPVTLADDYIADVPISVGYVTRDGTATTGSDYSPTSGTLTIAAEETAASVTVQVIADTVQENDETFSLILLDPSEGAEIVDGEGVGTIENDD